MVLGEINYAAADIVAAAASQLATDQAAVDAEKANIVTGTTILTKAGSYPTTAASKAAQLADDVLLVAAQAAKIVAGTAFTGGLGTVGDLEPSVIVAYASGIAAGGTLARSHVVPPKGTLDVTLDNNEPNPGYGGHLRLDL